MPPLRVFLTQDFPKPLLDQIRAVSPRLELTVAPLRPGAELPADVIGDTEVLYTGGPLPQPEAAPRLKWVQYHYAGVDRVLGHPLLKTGVQITTMSGVHATQMAEYVLMMMLAWGHHLPRLLELQRKGEWPSERWGPLSPAELREATLGIVGYGSIGREVARLARAFGMQVLATRRHAMDPRDAGYVPAGQGDPAGDMLRRL
ncbi:MAG: hypothetical protein HY784_03260, partial [Chloroflexi bacterium]|nr:hypothetical protein [Chloroflexota bacterium]